VLEREGLTERHAGPGDRRGVTVQPAQHGKDNYALVRREWASAAAAAAGNDTSNLDAALRLLRAVQTGLASTRPLHQAGQPR